jgi:hypothetical protein
MIATVAGVARAWISAAVSLAQATSPEVSAIIVPCLVLGRSVAVAAGRAKGLLRDPLS